METLEAMRRRRSCRKYTPKSVPPEVIEKAIDAALIAPNSSNMQTWQIYWVQSPDKKQKLVEACLSQSAAKTAPELLVFVSNVGAWKKHAKLILENFSKKEKPHPSIMAYYGKLIPFMYGWWILAPIKWLTFQIIGLFRPIMRHPWSARDVSEVSIKSTALACENFMLAIADQGYDTCPMEGLDECRVKRLLGLPFCARVVMAISVGERDPKGIWGEQFRVPKDTVFFKI